ncbi:MULTISPECIES: HD domain-containing protein [unclassified Variovorax]|uniref:HD domain-containing protein n=1 Tax=unclassified Variovorax TaxID=663243 RepID=UPI001316BDA7|nr:MULTISPECIES: HD domain-containing protein [unclassified Variovorax]VTU42603.1 Multifunctional CCA protein [Variovorax sp. PBL-H6]VTU43814.1 Multifunctional CCA protein [Variovorax sp. SRS16]VTU43879.1 Multifunctional CCA protein [Variovorax sp. PBL-E5]
MTIHFDIPAELAWLTAPAPHEELARLRASGELRRFLPEVDALYGIPQSPEHHPEIDTGRHIELTLEAAAMLSSDPKVRYAALVHDLGKALTPQGELPQHINHEHAGLAPVAEVSDRLGVPNDWKTLALLVCEHHLNVHRAFEMNPRGVIRLFERLPLVAQPELLEPFLIAVEADKRGRAGQLHRDYRQGIFLREAFRFLLENPIPPYETIDTPAGVAVHRTRLTALAEARRAVLAA